MVREASLVDFQTLLTSILSDGKQARVAAKDIGDKVPWYHTVFSSLIIRSDSSHPLAAVTMSKTTPTASSSSSSLDAIFTSSLKEYEKKTEKSLLTDPLMARFHACDSPTDILGVLRSQVAQFEETTAADEKLIKWLNPIVNVLSASSSVISAGVGLVNSIQMVLLRSNV